MNNRRKSRKRKGSAEHGSSIRPEQFPLASAKSRAAARALLAQNQKRIQVIFHCPELPLSLEKSRCFRNECPDGTILEVLEIDGNAAELSEVQLEEFVLGHPISYEGERNTDHQLGE
jgi:hypothetical protein